MKISKTRRIREGYGPRALSIWFHSDRCFADTVLSSFFLEYFPILSYRLFFWDILNNYIFHCNGGCVCFNVYKEDYN